MFAIVGAAGKVGYSTALALRNAGVPVRAVLRDPAKAKRLSEIGCDIGLADVQDPTALGRAIANADAVQVILPPPLQAQDAVGEMCRTIESLAEALEKARPRRLLAISDYGAHVREDIGMPTVFRILEERLRQLEMPKVFLRSAEHMEGWGAFVPGALATGVLPSLHHPIGSNFPTVSASDVGLIAADLLLRASSGSELQVVHAEGPRRCSAADVAAALSQLGGRTITAQGLPRSQWQQSLERILSASAAQLVIKLYDAHNEGGLIDVEPNQGEVRYGTTELVEALRSLMPSAPNAT
ncbi:MAG: NAD(P)H-binding protein [Polyangiaceae bacterium]